MGTWKEIQLVEVSNSYSGGTPKRDNPEFFNGDIPWVSSGEVNQPYINITKETITELGLSSSSAKWIPKNSILIAMYGATAGQVSKLLINATSNQAVLAIIPNEKDLDADFLFYQLRYNKEKLLFLAQGSGQPNLSKQLIDKTWILLPLKTEQTRIAEILSTADQAIEQTEGLIAKYQRIKTGLMQDLLTRGIDEHGNIRSKATHKFVVKNGMEVPEEWEVEPLEKHCGHSAFGPRFPGSMYSQYGNIGTLRTTDLDAEGNIDYSTIPLAKLNENEFKTHILKDNDFLVTSTTLSS